MFKEEGMRKYIFFYAIGLVSILLFSIPSNSYAQEEIISVTASGFGATEEKALEQASFHAVVLTVDKTFAQNNVYAGIKNDVRQFIEGSFSGFVGDLSEVKVIKKYRRNKITARIPVKEAELLTAIKSQFPDLEQ